MQSIFSLTHITLCILSHGFLVYSHITCAMNIVFLSGWANLTTNDANNRF